MKPTFFRTAADFRAWLEENHANEDELLVGFRKRGTGKPSITWPESVDQALCFGWIDGVRRSIDAGGYSIRFTPRRPRSIWSAVNVKRFGELSKAGLVHPAGREAFAARSDAKTGIYSYEQRHEAKLSPEQDEALRANAKAWAFFQAQPPWYRQSAIYWVVTAKKEETRARRLAALIDDSAHGRTVAPLTRPTGKK